MIGSLLALLSIIAKIMAGNQERTFIMVKPDGVQRGLVGEIIKRFEAKGFKLVALKLVWVSLFFSISSTFFSPAQREFKFFMCAHGVRDFFLLSISL